MFINFTKTIISINLITFINIIRIIISIVFIVFIICLFIKTYITLNSSLNSFLSSSRPKYPSSVSTSIKLKHFSKDIAVSSLKIKRPKKRFICVVKSLTASKTIANVPGDIFPKNSYL